VRDDQPVYALTASMKAGALEKRTKDLGEFMPNAEIAAKAMEKHSHSVVYLNRETLVPCVIEYLAADGTVSSTTTFSNLKFNVALADELFKYTPPADVKVLDMDELMDGLRGKGKGADQKTTQPPEPPKADF